MRIMQTSLYFGLWIATLSAAALDIPETPPESRPEYQSCEITAHDGGDVRHSVFQGWRHTWTDDGFTYVVVKGDRTTAGGGKAHIESKVKRREVPDGELTRETLDQVNVVTTNGVISTTITHREDVLRLTKLESGAVKRELIKRTTDGVLNADVREIELTTVDGSAERKTDVTTTTGVAPAVLEIHSLCTFNVPAS